LSTLLDVLSVFRLFAHIPPECERNFLGFPQWYSYLAHAHPGDGCAPKLTGINDVWLIGLAVVEILLRVAMLAAIAFTVYAGIKFAASRGNSDKVQSARNTLLDALTGLIIAIIATAVVAYIGRSFS
jgi:ABC-type Fe3+ transport system permease subunit